MYSTKEQDHEKRKNQEGSYSVYNYMYHYLLDNYEPEQDIDPVGLVTIGKRYCIKGGNKIDTQELSQYAKKAIENFKANGGEHGDTARNLGKRQDNSFDNIKETLSDLRW